MRAAYLWLARIIALLVVVQAMFITFMTMGLMKWIYDGGGTLDRAVLDSWDANPPEWTGAIGYPVHAIFIGQMALPAVAIVMLIASFFAKVPKGVHIAVAILILVILQIGAGMAGDANPYFGLWHGLGAFLIFGAAMAAAMKAKEAPTAVTD